MNGMHECGHRQRRIVEQRLDGFVNHHGVEERLIALNVDDNRIGGKIQRLNRF